MTRDYPDSPEAVALELLRMIETSENKTARDRRNVTESARLLDLYAECLAATMGKRESAYRPSVMH
jgi:hypothetical protein